MYTAIYRDFRPDNFDQLVGQDHIVKILKNQIASGRTGHAYLFCGTRGTGKTTSARILAKALNCEGEGERPCGQCYSCQSIKDGTFMDVIEIDAASNNGVDNIRELRESVKYPPVRGRNKVYIIDEVHMLSSGAFNALLKTLEEPPEHVVFILATTEPQKLPATILSRCMRLDFRRVSEKVIIQNMRMICDARGIAAEDSALSLIALNADGSVRDSLSILEQCISTGNSVTRDDVAELLGTAGEDVMIALTDCVMKADIPQALIILDSAINAGRDVKQFMKEWLTHFRNLLMAKYITDAESALNMSLENANRVKAQSADISTDLLNRGITELTKAIADSKWSSQPRVILEMCIVRLGVGQEVEKALVFQYDGRMSGIAPGSIPAPQTPSAHADTMAKPSEKAAAPAETDMGYGEIPPWEDMPAEAFDALVAGADMGAFGEPDFGDMPSAEPKAKKSDAAASVEETQLKELWAKVITKSIGERPMLIRLEKKSSLSRVDDKNFYVIAEDTMTERMLTDKGRDILEDKMEMYYGKRLSLCLEKKGAVKAPEKSPEDELARSISERFNIKVEIK